MPTNELSWDENNIDKIFDRNRMCKYISAVENDGEIIKTKRLT